MNAMIEMPALCRNRIYVQTDLGPLAVRERGDGSAPVVLWPSIFTDHRIFDPLVTRLGHKCRFILVDGPGHGESAGVTQEFSMDDCATALGRIMDRCGLERAIVGGTSWGGLVSARFALGNPSRVGALVLMNTPMQIDGRKPPVSSRLIALGARWGLGTRVLRDGIAGRFFSTEGLAGNPAYAHAFHDMLRAADPYRLAAAIRSVILRGAPLFDRLDDIDVPTLVIGGEEDAMYPLAIQAAAALRLHRGQFEPVPGRHISVVDAADETAAAVDRFVSEVCPT